MTTKTKLVTTLSACSLALSMAQTTFADTTDDVESTISDTTIITPPSQEQIVPSTETPSSSQSTDDISQTITDDSSTTSSSSSEETKSDEPSTTDTATETEDQTPEEKTTGTPQPDQPVEVPTTDVSTATVVSDTSIPTTNPNISAQTAHNAGASQVGTTSTVTGQIVRDVTTSNPVTLASGYTVTDIQQGVATLANGSKVNLTDLGVTKNSDGTFTATTASGEKVTLPETGQCRTIAVVIGMILLLIGAFLKGKENGFFLRSKKERSSENKKF